ncbi:MAG: transcriptional regulator [Bacteroidetes bacterium HGW-Bacteroidetes-1]|jgi:predicted transcriptional regulator|nr:MAG: transcriptional regulator [Bacteroidetes bacterium HGW-Bacteroidetes-1]
MPKTPIYTESQKKMARITKAMSHPARVMILELLSQQSCCYSGDLAEDLPIARSTLSQHLKELKDAGLIQGEVLPPKIKYCLNRENWMIAQQLFTNIFNLKLNESC